MELYQHGTQHSALTAFLPHPPQRSLKRKASTMFQRAFRRAGAPHNEFRAIPVMDKASDILNEAQFTVNPIVQPLVYKIKPRNPRYGDYGAAPAFSTTRLPLATSSHEIAQLLNAPECQPPPPVAGFISQTIEHLVCSISPTAGFQRRWAEYLKAYAMGKYNVSSPPIPPPRLPTFTFLPAPFPLDEAERVQACQSLGDKDPNWMDDISSNSMSILRNTVDLFGCAAAISTFNHDREIILAQRGLDLDWMKRSDSIAAHVLMSDTIMVILDASQDWRFARNPLVIGNPTIRFFAGAPMIAPTGHILGVISIFSTQPCLEFSRELVKQFEELAATAQTALFSPRSVRAPEVLCQQKLPVRLQYRGAISVGSVAKPEKPSIVTAASVAATGDTPIKDVSHRGVIEESYASLSRNADQDASTRIFSRNARGCGTIISPAPRTPLPLPKDTSSPSCQPMMHNISGDSPGEFTDSQIHKRSWDALHGIQRSRSAPGRKPPSKPVDMWVEPMEAYAARIEKARARASQSFSPQGLLRLASGCTENARKNTASETSSISSIEERLLLGDDSLAQDDDSNLQGCSSQRFDCSTSPGVQHGIEPSNLRHSAADTEGSTSTTQVLPQSDSPCVDSSSATSSEHGPRTPKFVDFMEESKRVDAQLDQIRAAMGSYERPHYAIQQHTPENSPEVYRSKLGSLEIRKTIVELSNSSPRTPPQQTGYSITSGGSPQVPPRGLCLPTPGSVYGAHETASVGTTLKSITIVHGMRVFPDAVLLQPNASKTDSLQASPPVLVTPDIRIPPRNAKEITKTFENIHQSLVAAHTNINTAKKMNTITASPISNLTLTEATNRFKDMTRFELHEVQASAESRFAAELWARTMGFDLVYAIHVTTLKPHVTDEAISRGSPVSGKLLVSWKPTQKVSDLPCDAGMHMDALRMCNATSLWQADTASKPLPPDTYARGFLASMATGDNATSGSGVVFGAFKKTDAQGNCPDLAHSDAETITEIRQLRLCANALSKIIVKDIEKARIAHGSQREQDRKYMASLALRPATSPAPTPTFLQQVENLSTYSPMPRIRDSRFDANGNILPVRFATLRQLRRQKSENLLDDASEKKESQQHSRQSSSDSSTMTTSSDAVFSKKSPSPPPATPKRRPMFQLGAST